VEEPQKDKKAERSPNARRPLFTRRGAGGAPGGGDVAGTSNKSSTITVVAGGIIGPFSHAADKVMAAQTATCLGN